MSSIRSTAGSRSPSGATGPDATDPATVTDRDLVTSAAGRKLLGLTRISLGFVFAWAFLDKTFGLHYSTGAPVAEGSPSLSWLDGGTPSQGFMKFATVGPLQDFFASIASPATDWLFMLSLLGLGVAVTLGIGLKVSAVVGTFLMVAMWVAEWPLLQGSTNPVMDYHLIYAFVLIIFAVLRSGDTWGLGRTWAGLRLVRENTWLR